MQVQQNQVHPDWIARLEMFRQFTSRAPEVQDTDSDQTIPSTAATSRWPLPKLSYRHRSTFSPRPR